MAIKYAAKPVVAAPFGMTLGGGCECHCTPRAFRLRPKAIWAWWRRGGIGPRGRRLQRVALAHGDAKKAFELIGFAKVSASAADARDLGLLRPQDDISMNAERLIADAKALALAWRRTMRPALRATDIPVAGEAG